MITPQHGIGSGFGFESTAREVLAGVDLSGRLAVVTGGYSGLGLETTRALAEAGARVVVPARRPAAAKEALEGVGDVEVDELDLADLESVRGFADRFLESGRGIDMIIGNAAVMACPETRVGPGWEAQFATNHLGHFALTQLLWTALTAADTARVVAVASGYSPHWQIRWDDIHFSRGYDKWEAYTQSKLANILFARQLDRLGARSGVRAFSVNPGWILTPLQRHLTTAEMVAAGWINADGTPKPGLFKSPEQGAATMVWAATSRWLDGHGGAYCADCRITEGPPDSDEAASLWAVSTDLTGLDRVP